jgi:hypothetical protein
MRTILSVGIGIASAVLTVVVMNALGWRQGSADTEAAASSRREKEVVTVIRERADQGQLAALRRDVEQLRAQPGATQEDEAEPSLSPEEERDKLEERFQGLADAHERQAPDMAWARPAEASLERGIAPLARDLGFDVKRIECKTSSCRVRVRFSDFDKARHHAELLAQHVYGDLNCARQIYAPDPQDRSASYETDLYLDCSLARAGKADRIQ